MLHVLFKTKLKLKLNGLVIKKNQCPYTTNQLDGRHVPHSSKGEANKQSIIRIVPYFGCSDRSEMLHFCNRPTINSVYVNKCNILQEIPYLNIILHTTTKRPQIDFVRIGKGSTSDTRRCDP